MSFKVIILVANRRHICNFLLVIGRIFGCIPSTVLQKYKEVYRATQARSQETD